MKKFRNLAIVLSAIIFAANTTSSESWREHYCNGLQSNKEGLYYSAITQLDEVAKLCPNLPEAYIERGIAYYNLDLNNEALADFNSVIRIDSSRAVAYYYLGQISKESKKFDEALNYFNKLVELDSTYYKPYFQRGMVYYELKKYEEAIDDLSNSIDLNPKNDLAFFYEGKCYERLNDLEMAILDFKIACNLYPEDSLYKFTLASAYLENGEYSNALEIFNLIINNKQSFNNIYSKRGLCFCNLNKIPEAIADFEKATTLKEDDSLFAGDLAICYMLNKQYMLAIAAFSNLILFGSNDRIIYSNLAFCQLELKDPDKAIVNFKTSLEITNLNFESYLGLSFAYFMKNEFNEAKENILIAVKLEPKLKYGSKGLAMLMQENYFYSEMNMTLIDEIIKYFQINN